MAAPIINRRIVNFFFKSYILWAFLAFVCGSDDVLFSLVVEHTFDRGSNAAFTRRGVIDVHSTKAGSASYTDEYTLTASDRNRLKSMAENDDMYRIRIGRWTEDEKSVVYVYTFIKACALYESKLSEILTLHFDQSDVLISASVSAPIPYCSFRYSSISPHDINEFNTTVIIQQTVNGPVPDTQSYIQKIEQEKNGEG